MEKYGVAGGAGGRLGTGSKHLVNRSECRRNNKESQDRRARERKALIFNNIFWCWTPKYQLSPGYHNPGLVTQTPCQPWNKHSKQILHYTICLQVVFIHLFPVPCIWGYKNIVWHSQKNRKTMMQSLGNSPRNSLVSLVIHHLIFLNQ